MTKPWNELSSIEQLLASYSDVHKDAYGFRSPPPARYLDMSEEELQAEFDKMYKVIGQNIQEEKALEEQAVLEFEDRIQGLLVSGCSSRYHAIDTLMDMEGALDLEHLEYLCGLPYNYLKK